MKRCFFIFSIYTLLLVMFFFVSCSQQEKVVLLKVHFIGASPTDLQMVEDKVNEYLIETYNIKIKMTFTDFGDFDAKSNLIINSGEEYDIIFTSSWANNYLVGARKGAFLDMTDYLESEEFSLLYNTIDKGFWDGSKIDGRIYAVPVQKEIALMQMYLYNKKIVTEIPFDYKSVKNIKDVEPYLAYVKENYPNVIPYFMSIDKQYRGPYDYVLGFDVPLLVDGNGKVRFNFEVSDILENIRTIRKYYQKGYINQDAATTSGTLPKGFVFGMSQADGQPYAELIWSIDSGFDIVASDVSPPVANTQSTRGSMLAINSNSKYPKEAMLFLQVLNTDSFVRNLINYGIEGVHYTKVSDNQIETTAQAEKYSVSAFALGNLFITYIRKDAPKDLWEVFKQVNDATIKSPLLGFNVNIDPIKNELAAINNLSDQYEPVIITGSVDIDSNVAEYKKKLMEVGLQKVIDEVQQQVDAFLAINN